MAHSLDRIGVMFAAGIGLICIAPQLTHAQAMIDGRYYTDSRYQTYPQYQEMVPDDDDDEVVMAPVRPLFGPRPPMAIPNQRMAIPNQRYVPDARYVPDDRYGPDQNTASPDQRIAPQDDTSNEAAALPPQFRRQAVAYPTREPRSTIVIDTSHAYLYYVLGEGRAIRYGIGVGREGFTWSGVRNIDRKQEWPDWHPPAEMIARQPYLPRFMAGGPGNPLGARAMYLKGTLFRIHGTSEPDSIGKHVSSGCIRMLNADAIDLYNRTPLGTKVVVLPDHYRSRDDATVVRPQRQSAIPATPRPRARLY